MEKITMFNTKTELVKEYCSNCGNSLIQTVSGKRCFRCGWSPADNTILELRNRVIELETELAQTVPLSSVKTLLHWLDIVENLKFTRRTSK